MYLPFIFYGQGDEEDTLFIRPEIQKTKISGVYFSYGNYAMVSWGMQTGSVDGLYNKSSFFNEANSEINALKNRPDAYETFATNPFENKKTFVAHTGIILKLRNDPVKKNAACYLKIGVNYFSDDNLYVWNNGVSNRKTTKGFYFKDNQIIDRDSITKTTLSVLSQAQNINLESEIIVSTNQNNFISGYCGTGVLFGIYYSGSHKVSYQKDEAIHDRSSYTYIPVYNEAYSTILKQESIKSKPTISFGVVANFGVEIKILKNLRFYTEFKPVFRACQVIKNKFAGSNIYQLNFGLKLRTSKELKAVKPIVTEE